MFIKSHHPVCTGWTTHHRHVWHNHITFHLSLKIKMYFYIITWLRLWMSSFIILTSSSKTIFWTLMVEFNFTWYNCELWDSQCQLKWSISNRFRVNLLNLFIRYPRSSRFYILGVCNSSFLMYGCWRKARYDSSKRVNLSL